MTTHTTIHSTSRLRLITIAAAAAVSLGLTACGSAEEAVTERILEEAGGGSVDVEIGEDGEDGEIASIETEDGSLDIEVGGDLPAEWPSDVPAFEDGTLTSNQVYTGDGKVTVSLSYSSDRSAAEIVEAMTPRYEGAGFVVNSSGSMGDATQSFVTMAAVRGDTTVSISAASGEDTTEVVIGLVYPEG